MVERQGIVILTVKGSYTSKPRPCVVIQGDDFLETDSVTLCLMTSERVFGAPMLRVDVQPSRVNGLREPSQIQVDKIVTVPRAKIKDTVGRLEDEYMRRLDEAVRFFLDLDR
ncbi:type II toxin-antitoxin system PemK/MazF family toxin [Methylobacterium sp. J-068]|uniref:type II toxin-antitoxin system PemK/MazF family toxin n=1 Tax=Methylobacterium sp. J-068 TaxID=2836649 RepID=UPI001FB90ADE|nr:type II toxin-antitoxin system PemK/MazF family toxin [Methylobacterium sp. J-068]MCJ2036551.1 type II toxin-antitoxin system PemK/MazF family toxin [Methylobacterium sp. J-068]